MPPIILKPPAAPTPREGDEELTIPQVEQISLFKELSSAPKLQSLPGTVILRRFKPGDVIWTPPGVRHWHGATATNGMTHIAITEALEGKNVEWMEKVTDAQYNH